MFQKITGKVLTKRKIKKQMLDLFKKNSNYMESGIYSFDNSSSYIYLKDKQVKKKAEEVFSKTLNVLDYSNKSILKKSIIYLTQNLFFNRPNIDGKRFEDDMFKGQVFLPGRNLSGFKVFDFRQGLVMTKVSSDSQYDKLVTTYNYFKNYFHIPTSEFYSNNIIVEEMIDYKPTDDWDNEEFKHVIDNVFETYLNYFKEIKSNNTIIEYYNVKDYYNKILRSESAMNIDFLYDICDEEILNTQYPFIRQHGDLWTSNLLFDKNQENKYILLTGNIPVNY